ncbi:MFP1 attachment factor 1-like [Vigna unguiculata]|uniref:Ran GTPase-activating protein 1 n=1 Tax=Vigna unguiculata TaxID=3917 RepID=A0A4D6MFC3_VIGUN|nr:MFP1 attachment factor 1-like [Vigna unguiculata]QCD99008.1 Ran GTPase-activating protein 1 [Vigna unguiculata]
MSDTETTPDQPSVPPQTEAPPQPDPSAALSFTIWPPTDRTRDAIVNRLIETLTTPSVLSKRYGTLSSDEASAAARQIEGDAFSAAGASVATSADGIETLQLYSKEISKRMLDAVKTRAPPGSAAVEGVATVVSE